LFWRRITLDRLRIGSRSAPTSVSEPLSTVMLDMLVRSPYYEPYRTVHVRNRLIAIDGNCVRTDLLDLDHGMRPTSRETNTQGHLQLPSDDTAGYGTANVREHSLCAPHRVFKVPRVFSGAPVAQFPSVKRACRARRLLRDRRDSRLRVMNTSTLHLPADRNRRTHCGMPIDIELGFS
jgi:hypothetical protein